MTRLLVAGALAVLSTACLNQRTYMDPDSQASAWGGEGTGIASLRGDVGQLTSIDNSSTSMWVTRDTRVLNLSGDVPHQARSGSSVWLDVRIANPRQLPIGDELRQEGTQDAWGAAEGDGPVLDVYVCPNGEGVSGYADDIVVTRTGPETFTFQATSTNAEQNLNIDLDLAAE